MLGGRQETIVQKSPSAPSEAFGRMGRWTLQCGRIDCACWRTQARDERQGIRTRGREAWTPIKSLHHDAEIDRETSPPTSTPPLTRQFSYWFSCRLSIWTRARDRSTAAARLWNIGNNLFAVRKGLSTTSNAPPSITASTSVFAATISRIA
jgi:hypothetical protein